MRVVFLIKLRCALIRLLTTTPQQIAPEPECPLSKTPLRFHLPKSAYSAHPVLSPHAPAHGFYVRGSLDWPGCASIGLIAVSQAGKNQLRIHREWCNNRFHGDLLLWSHQWKTSRKLCLLIRRSLGKIPNIYRNIRQA